MDSYRRVLTIQDISCVGQCSLTVAGPIISACGAEACVLPSAVLSNHTGAGFGGFTFRDLTEELPKIMGRWRKEGIRFDAVYSGYLGSEEQIASVRELMRDFLREGGLRIADPAMADHGKLYQGFDAAFVSRMAELCGEADVILPNLTEACLMTGTEYREDGHDRSYVQELLKRLRGLCAGTIVLKGISPESGKLGNAVYDARSGETSFYFAEKLARKSHGTGDCFASAFTGAVMRGLGAREAAELAADFVVESILQTEDDPEHWYGVKFERALRMLVNRLQRRSPLSEKAAAAADGRYAYVLDGALFSDLEGFYAEIERLMTDGKVRTGHNLDAFHDVLRGGFGRHSYGEPIELLWKNFGESRETLGTEKLLQLMSVMLDRSGDHDCTLRLEP